MLKRPLLPMQPAPSTFHEHHADILEGERRSVKKVRASRPKVKSGCFTCKTRRVKCDETKPQCLRCQKSGRDCKGYSEPRPGRALAPIQPRIPSVSLYAPKITIHSSDDESRYFQAFRERSAYELSGFFDTDFWAGIVLRESHAITPIRHAILAIGALNKSLEGAAKPELKVNVIQSVDKKHHEQAVVHYLKAVQTLNHYISTSSSPQLRVALISCLLFIAFETFQGSFATSIQQTYGGLKILRSYYSGKPGSKPWIPSRPLRAPLPDAEKSQITKRLQIRLGCDSVSKERAMALHVEEYLDIDSDQGNFAAIEDDALSVSNTEPTYDLSVEQVRIPYNPMIGTNIDDERRRTSMSAPAEEAHSPDWVISDSPATNDTSMHPSSEVDNARSISSTFANSTASTPAGYTPPSATDTSSLSQNAPAQAGMERPPDPQSPTASKPILHNDLIIEESLIQTFVRLDGQGLFFGMVPGIPPLIWDLHKAHHIDIPSKFPDFAAAHRCWDFLQDRALQFLRRTLFDKAYAPGNSEPVAEISKQYAKYIRQLSAFWKAFQPNLHSAVASNGRVVNPAALVIAIYHKTTVITLAAVQNDSEMIYDSFLGDFQYITRTCATLVSQESMAPSKNTRFSFEVGIVPPLHVTATKCRDPFVRREAIELLFASPRQEGMWDGVLAARIGKWMMSCEEDGLPAPPLTSQELSLSGPPSDSGFIEEVKSFYPSPPQIPDEIKQKYGDPRYDELPSLNEVIGSHLSRLSDFDSVHLPPPNVGRRRHRSTSRSGHKRTSTNEWTVPEEARVRLTIVDFHIPDRYIRVKCQKSLLSQDGSREERETIIAW